jgi:molecular chaperone GrpE
MANMEQGALPDCEVERAEPRSQPGSSSVRAADPQPGFPFNSPASQHHYYRPTGCSQTLDAREARADLGDGFEVLDIEEGTPAHGSAPDQDEYEIDGDALLAAPLGEAEETAEPEAGFRALRARLEGVEAENARLRQSLLRWQAEFESLRRRQAREQEAARQQIQEDLLKQLLPLVDNFERALGHSMGGAAGEEFFTGIVLMYKQLNELLKCHNVLPIMAAGEVFNPDLHEAVAIESRPGYETHTVIAEVEKGYTIGTRLLRPARVKVATRNQ